MNNPETSLVVEWDRKRGHEWGHERRGLPDTFVWQLLGWAGMGLARDLYTVHGTLPCTESGWYIAKVGTLPMYQCANFRPRVCPRYQCTNFQTLTPASIFISKGNSLKRLLTVGTLRLLDFVHCGGRNVPMWPLDSPVKAMAAVFIIAYQIIISRHAFGISTVGRDSGSSWATFRGTTSLSGWAVSRSDPSRERSFESGSITYRSSPASAARNR